MFPRLFAYLLMTVIYREILNDHDSIMLQSDIIAIYQWCDVWTMSLNTNKCKFMHVSFQAHETKTDLF